MHWLLVCFLYEFGKAVGLTVLVALAIVGGPNSGASFVSLFSPRACGIAQVLHAAICPVGLMGVIYAAVARMLISCVPSCSQLCRARTAT